MKKFQFWHLRDLNLWPTRYECTRNPLHQASTSERQTVYSRVEFLRGDRDILEPKVTCQRAFVRFHTMFSIMKTMTKYLLGMYIMTNITYMIDKHSKKFYIRYKNFPSYYVLNYHWSLTRVRKSKKMAGLQITVTLSIFDVWTKKRQGFKAER